MRSNQKNIYNQRICD